MSTDSECFFPQNLLPVSWSCMYANNPLMNFLRKTRKNVTNGAFFYNTAGDAPKSFSVKDYLTVLACLRKNFSRAKLKFLLELERKKKNGEIWSIINWTFDEEKTMNIDQNKKILIGVALGVYLLYKILGGWTVFRLMILLRRFFTDAFSLPYFSRRVNH